MGRKKEIVEVDKLAVGTTGVKDAFMEDTTQQEEFGYREEGMDPDMESGGEEPGDVADDIDNPGEDALPDYMEEENALMESPEDAEEEMPGREQLDESGEHQDADGEDICENGETGETAVTEDASGLAENATEPEDVPEETAAEEPAPAKPKRSSRKKKTVSDKAENEAETTGEQGDAETGVRPEVEVQPETVPEEGLLEEALLSAEESNPEIAEDLPDMDADNGGTLTLDSENPEEADEWEDAYDETEEESAEGTTEEVLEGTVEFADETTAVSRREAQPGTASERRPADSAPRRTTGGKKAEAPVLTLEARGEVETEESREDVIWHEIHNAYRTRRILTGQLGGIEQTDNGKTIAIVDYKGFRIVIPLKEMMINVGHSPSGQEYAELMLRQNKILGNMLGAEIDFIVKGIDSKARSVVASRREAMLKKRQIFYLDTDASGMYRVHEGRIVQARVIAVAEKVLRVEVFGVECSIMARDLAWDWIGDAHERFSVGDQVLVRVLSVRRDGLEEIAVKADIKSVSQNTSHDNLKKCRIQSKYAGKVTDVHKGVVYIRLSNGVNAVAHSCYDYRTPGKKDDVSFAVTRLDEERGVAVGIITRVIRRNL
nr:S1 RNA-binding domain-containing protein [uncultured Acetatifactor sp.]